MSSTLSDMYYKRWRTSLRRQRNEIEFNKRIAIGSVLDLVRERNRLVPTAGDESTEAVIVPGATVRGGGLVAAHQLAQKFEEGQAQGARRHPRLTAVRAQHLQLHRLGARAHPRRYRRPMPRAVPGGHSAGSARAPDPRDSPLANCDTRPARALWPVAGLRLVYPHTLAPSVRRAHPPFLTSTPSRQCCRSCSVLS